MFQANSEMRSNWDLTRTRPYALYLFLGFCEWVYKHLFLKHGSKSISVSKITHWLGLSLAKQQKLKKKKKLMRHLRAAVLGFEFLEGDATMVKRRDATTTSVQ